MKITIQISLVSLLILAGHSMAQTAEASKVEQISSKSTFGSPLTWVGVQPSEAESASLLQSLEALNAGNIKTGLASAEQFLKDNPNSAWGPNLRVCLAEYYRDNGRYSPALAHWENVWAATKDSKDAVGQKIAVRSFAGWTRLLGNLGRKDELTVLFKELNDRQLPLGTYSPLIDATYGGLVTMNAKAGDAYRCGSFALANAARALQLDKALVDKLAQTDSPDGGFHIAELLNLAETNGFAVEAVWRPAGEKIVVPSVVHWKLNHYAAVVAETNGFYKVVDPTFRGHAWLDMETIDSETSGVFVVPKDKAPQGWTKLSAAESARIYGKGTEGDFLDEDDEGPCICDPDDDDPPASNDGPGGGGDDPPPDDGCPNCPPPSSAGMPVWEVSEPYQNLWLKDTPLFYRASNGKWVNLQLRYKHRGEDKGVNVGGFGPYWECNLLGMLQVNSNALDVYVNHAAGGGLRSYAADGTPDYKSQRQYMLSAAQGTTSGGSGGGAVVSGSVPSLKAPSGSRAHYEFMANAGLGKTNFFVTHRIDRYGRAVLLKYQTIGSMVRLTNVVDLDGKSLTLAYTNTTFTNQITSVTDPYGRSAYFKYNGAGLLTNIIDMAGMSTYFQYDSSLRITSMVTPYGTSSFEYFLGVSTNYNNTLRRALRVTEPSNDKQLYTYCDQGPAGYRFSYHYNRAQYAALSSAAKAYVLDIPAGEFDLGTAKYWLRNIDIAGQGHKISDTVYSVAKAKDAWGTRATTYFGYRDSSTAYVGTQKKIQEIAHNAGSTFFIERNDLGRPTVSTYYSGAKWATYTNNYDTQGRLLQTVYGPHGERVRGYGYSATVTNLLTSVTNAVGDVIRYTHDATSLKVTSVTLASGLVRSNVYFASGTNNGFMSAQLEIGIRTNYFNYLNGNISAQTNELGLAVTNLYDNLNRLISSTYPDGTTISNVYDKLDLVAAKDRLNHWNYSGYNLVRQLVAVTNASGQVTTYDYCSCGSPSTITRWNGSTAVSTQYSYDMAGNLTNVVHPDGYQLNYTYNDDDLMTSVTDSSGYQLSFEYILLGTQFKIANVIVGGQYLLSNTFDEYGRLAAVKDRNWITVTNVYDSIGRITNRMTLDVNDVPSNSVSYAYTSRGLTNYTDELNRKTWFVYDTAGRLLSQTNANTEDLQFTYNPSDEMLTLKDGKSQQTIWNYDEYGRVTNKLDAVREIFRYKYDQDNRLTNRWTTAKGDTYYGYDLIGNLTNVDYPGTIMDVVLKYDGLNRLTNAVDAIGTTAFGYTDAGQLLSEDGPWASDTVNYTYDARRRVGMSVLQPNASPWTQSYGYDSINRLSNVVSAAGSFVYEYGFTVVGDRVRYVYYPPASALVQNDYDDLARLSVTTLKNPSGAVLNQHAYAINEANQRIQQTSFDGNPYNNNHYTDYTYDNIGQLKTAKGTDHVYDFNSGLFVDTSRLNEQFGYAYDKASNLNQRTNNALVQTFGVNTLNELTNVTRSGTFTVAGMASERRVITTGYHGVTNVVVSGTGLTSGNAELYVDGAWAKTNATLANGNNTYSATAKDDYNRTATDSLTLNLPAMNTFSYDGNGNLTNDGWRVFEYDFENQLTNVYVASAWRSEFKYDAFGRRRVRKEYTWQSSAWTLTNEVRYVYDGMLVVQERDANNLALVSYTRGNDLNGSLQGAGGIGGLLARTDNSQLIAGNTSAHAYYHCDGNGNITALMNTNGILVARYNYDPYGNLLGMSGPLAEANAYRFSSKEWCAIAGLYYYGFRFYEPNLQRWLNRDPIQEWGGLNFYAFINNSVGNDIDPYGLQGDLSLGDGYSCRVDSFGAGSGSSHEIHVYKEHTEVGVFGPNGWINKHGFKGGPTLPPNVANTLNGVSVDAMRRQQLIPPKGMANIRGLRGRLNGVAPWFAWLPDLIDAIKTTVDAIRNHKSFKQEAEDDFKKQLSDPNAAPYFEDWDGTIQRNPYFHGCSA